MFIPRRDLLDTMLLAFAVCTPSTFWFCVELLVALDKALRQFGAHSILIFECVTLLGASPFCIPCLGRLPRHLDALGFRLLYTTTLLVIATGRFASLYAAWYGDWLRDAGVYHLASIATLYLVTRLIPPERRPRTLLFGH